MVGGLTATRKPLHEKVDNGGWLNSDQKNLYMKRWIMVGALTATRKPTHEKVSDSGCLHSDQ